MEDTNMHEYSVEINEEFSFIQQQNLSYKRFICHSDPRNDTEPKTLGY